MRDPKRIERILGKLQDLWLAYPDLRFCQLMGNATYPIEDPFYLEDELFEKRIDDIIATGWT